MYAIFKYLMSDILGSEQLNFSENFPKNSRYSARIAIFLTLSQSIGMFCIRIKLDELFKEF